MNFYQDFTQMFTKDQFITGALKSRDYLAVGIDKGNRPGSIIKYPEVKIVTMKKIKDFTDQPLKDVLVVGNTTEGKDISVTANDDITFSDSSKAVFGADSDLQIYHDGSHSNITNATGYLNIISDGANAGHMYIQQKNDNGKIIFQNDNGAGGLTTYLEIDGSQAIQYVKIRDSIVLALGNSWDFTLAHSSGQSVINNSDGDILIKNDSNGDSIRFDCEDGSNSTTEYFRLDGSAVRVRFSKDARFLDNAQVQLGSSGDLKIYHDGTDSYINETGTGGLILNASAISGTAIKDEDNMASDSATHLATQQSIKAYVDAQTQDSLAEVLTVGNTTGGTDISVSANDDIVMTDSSKIIMDSDFKIYKSIDNHSHIEEGGAGDLLLKSNNEVEIASGVMGEHFARFTKDAGVQLFHDNVKKFETTSNNIKVVGVAAHADNAAALTAGLTAGELYRTGDILKIVH